MTWQLKTILANFVNRKFNIETKNKLTATPGPNWDISTGSDWLTDCVAPLEFPAKPDLIVRMLDSVLVSAAGFSVFMEAQERWLGHWTGKYFN